MSATLSKAELNTIDCDLSTLVHLLDLGVGMMQGLHHDGNAEQYQTDAVMWAARDLAKKVLGLVEGEFKVPTPSGIPQDSAWQPDEDITEVAKLIEAHEAARALYDSIPDNQPDEVFRPVIRREDDALIALCAARPTAIAARLLRREYLNARLTNLTDGNEGLTRRVYEALVG